jgi:hypothetical protein
MLARRPTSCAVTHYYNRFNEADEADVGQPMLDGVSFLQQALKAVDTNTVVLLSIG